MVKNIFITGGGTGGHLMPAMAMCELIQSANIAEPILFTDLRCKNYLPSSLEYEHYVQELMKPNSLRSFMAFAKNLLKLIRQNIAYINRYKPRLLIACGGYTSLPLLLSAIIKRVPIILHEQNSTVGMANYIFSLFAKKLFLSFIHTVHLPLMRSADIIWTGSPILAKHRFAPKRVFNYKKQFSILVTGGSQGATVFDSLIPGLMQELRIKYPEITFRIIQQSKSRDLLAERYKEMGVLYEVQEFFHNLESYYPNVDLFIGRAGASTINDLIAYTLPAILIPYPHAKHNHQYYNAKNLLEFEAALLIEQKDVTAEELCRKTSYFIDNPESSEKMSQQLSKLKINTSKFIIEEIQKIIDN